MNSLDQLQSTVVLRCRNISDDKAPGTRQKRRLPKPHQTPPKRVKYSGAIPGSPSRVAPTTSPPLSNSKTPPKRRSNRSRNRPTFYSEELYTGQTPKTPGTPKPEPLDSIDDIATGDSVSFFLVTGKIYGCGTFRVWVDILTCSLLLSADLYHRMMMVPKDFRRMLGFKKHLQRCSGNNHALFRSGKGDLWAMGVGCQFQLGHIANPRPGGHPSRPIGENSFYPSFGWVWSNWRHRRRVQLACCDQGGRDPGVKDLSMGP